MASCLHAFTSLIIATPSLTDEMSTAKNLLDVILSPFITIDCYLQLFTTSSTQPIRLSFNFFPSPPIDMALSQVFVVLFALVCAQYTNGAVAPGNLTLPKVEDQLLECEISVKTMGTRLPRCTHKDGYFYTVNVEVDTCGRHIIPCSVTTEHCTSLSEAQSRCAKVLDCLNTVNSSCDTLPTRTMAEQCARRVVSNCASKGDGVARL